MPPAKLQPLLLVIMAYCLAIHAFVVPAPASSSCARYVCSGIPLPDARSTDKFALYQNRKFSMSASSSSSSTSYSSPSALLSPLRRLLSFAPALLVGPLLPAALDVPSAHAISGGGKDYAEAKIADQDFSGKDYSNKDFSGAFAQRTNFKGAKLMGARFYKSALTEADFTGADLSGASFEGANMVDTIFKDAVINNGYFTETVLKVGSIEGADFSDTLLDRFVQKKLCEKALGTNPKTKVDTRESLMCD